MDFYLGEIQLFPYGFVPRGFMACNGQTLQIQQYTALYALLGTTYGGNGTTNFMIPNLNYNQSTGINNAQPLRQGLRMQYYIAVEGLFPPRS